MISVKCDYYGAETSKKTAALFKAYDNGLAEVVDANSQTLLLQARVTDFNISSRLGQTPRYLTLETGEKIETTDNDAIDQWLKLAHPKRGANVVYWLESHWRTALASLIIVIVVLSLTVRFAVPTVSETIAFQLPASTLNTAAKRSLALLDAKFFEETQLSSEKQQQLLTSFQPALDQFPDQNIRVLFRHSETFGPNAFALPDGTVIFTDQIVNLAQHDEELIAILAHEIAHVVHRHSLRSIIQNSFYVIMLALITGDASGTTEALLGVPLVFVELANSRHHELEADTFASDWMQANNIPLHRFGDIMKRLLNTEDIAEFEEEHAWTQYLSTHPLLPERLEIFETHKEDHSQ